MKEREKDHLVQFVSMIMLFWIPASSSFSKFFIFLFFHRDNLIFISDSVQLLAFIIFLGDIEIVLATSMLHSPLLCSSRVFIFVSVFHFTLCKAFSRLLVQTTLMYFIAQPVLSFYKLLWHDLSARSIFSSYNSKSFVGTAHFIWSYSFYSSWHSFQYVLLL